MERIKLTDSQIALLKAKGHVINNNGIKYYNLPQWFAETDKQGIAEVFYEDQLPDNVKLFIREVSIKESLQKLVDIYDSSPYTMLMQEKWIEAFEDAKTALNYDI